MKKNQAIIGIIFTLMFSMSMISNTKTVSAVSYDVVRFNPAASVPLGENLSYVFACDSGDKIVYKYEVTNPPNLLKLYIVDLNNYLLRNASKPFQYLLLQETFYDNWNLVDITFSSSDTYFLVFYNDPLNNTGTVVAEGCLWFYKAQDPYPDYPSSSGGDDSQPESSEMTIPFITIFFLGVCIITVIYAVSKTKTRKIE